MRVPNLFAVTILDRNSVRKEDVVLRDVGPSCKEREYGVVALGIIEFGVVAEGN